MTHGNNKRSRGNGTIDKASRYVLLKNRLDQDSLFRNWHEEDTAIPQKTGEAYHFVDVFSGAGGMSLGFRDAGYKKVLSVEVDKDASATIRSNFPESCHFEKRIEDVPSGTILQATGNKIIHVVCGGPPCQGFSVAGLRNPQDPRNKLFVEFVRVVNALKPWFVVMENVPGILTMEQGKVFTEIIRQFKEIGYPGMSVRILEAAKFGIPQLRTRAVFIGNRFGLPNPYPKEQLASKDYRSIESAIDDLKALPRSKAFNHEWTDHSPEMERRIAKVPPGGSLYGSFRDAWKKQYRGVPCMTIKENHGGCHIHYELNRVLSAREMARLQTFPDGFIFSGTMKRAYWQIGNAVPCLLAKHIALALRPTIHKIKNASL